MPRSTYPGQDQTVHRIATTGLEQSVQSRIAEMTITNALGHRRSHSENSRFFSPELVGKD